MEAAGALVAAEPIQGSISNPPGVAGWSWGQCGCHRDPPVRPVLHIVGVKSQLLCGVRLELAIGSLPYPQLD